MTLGLDVPSNFSIGNNSNDLSSNNDSPSTDFFNSATTSARNNLLSLSSSLRNSMSSHHHQHQHQHQHDLLDGATTAARMFSPAVTVPHRGALYRLEDDEKEILYCIEIALENGSTHEVQYSRHDFDFAQRLFSILDTESLGAVDRVTVKEFVTLRCPVFWRRDEDIRRNQNQSNTTTTSTSTTTFDEVWKSVAICSTETSFRQGHQDEQNALLDQAQLGVEGWMVFCRFIALAQYLEAKRRFSARHLQQTMRHRNSPRGSELVVVDVPPQEPPVPLTPHQLVEYETKTACSPLPLPELDLDHTLLNAHNHNAMKHNQHTGHVQITLFGNSSSSAKFSKSLLPKASKSISSKSHYSTDSSIEFKLSYNQNDQSPGNNIVVRRSLEDMKWLNDTFTSHKVLGGTLCGRILPPFPGTSTSSSSKNSSKCGADKVDTYQAIKGTTGGAIAAATASVGIIKDAAKSFWGSYLLPATSSSSSLSPSISTTPSSATTKTTSPTSSNLREKKSAHTVNKTIPWPLTESYYNPNSPEGKARQIERYLNYLLQHPALSTSFPLNTILKASQSGLEAAKQTLEECSRRSNEIKEHAPKLDDGGKTTIPFWPLHASSSTSASASTLSWVRTAAQAAMALQLHGILETTGMQSASARLQHASLPTFVNPPSIRNGDWVCDEDAGTPGHGAAAATAAAAQAHLTGTMQTRTRRALVDPDGEFGDEVDFMTAANAVLHEDEEEGNSFEHGVTCVQSELEGPEMEAGDEDGYDLLPLPVPAPERRILTLGSSMMVNASLDSEGADDGNNTSNKVYGNINCDNDTLFFAETNKNKDKAATSVSVRRPAEARFHYGTNSLRHTMEHHRKDLYHYETCYSTGAAGMGGAYLGDISVDEHIDKLREVIGSVDNTLSRCLASSAAIGRARREKLALHSSMVRGFDSWEGLQGKFVSQRALLKGVSGIEQSLEVFEDSDLAITDDVSWQTCLAKSAVSAAEDVRSAVRAARTATNAKAAASAAAFAAQNACETGTFHSVDEARATQTRASIAQSHAFHATVVEHEANAVKRRATLALAHDVKCWNVHRKREMLKACLSYARSQHEATRRAVDAWSCLRDGYIGTTLIQSAPTRKHHHAPSTTKPLSSLQETPLQVQPKPTLTSFDSSGSANTTNTASTNHSISNTDWAAQSCCEQEEVTARIYQDLGANNNNNGDGQPVIVAVDHDVLTKASAVTTTAEVITEHMNKNSNNLVNDEPLPQPESILPLVAASPIPEEDDGDISATTNDFVATANNNNIHNNISNSSSNISNSFGSSSYSNGVTHATTNSLNSIKSILDDNCSSSHHGVIIAAAGSGEDKKTKTPVRGRKGATSEMERNTTNDTVLSASMQSLVDGLMTWGDQFDLEDDFALPAGMAASIVLEENNGVGNGVLGLGEVTSGSTMSHILS